MFSFRWNGMLQGNMKNKETRIHETQKPVALYKWLLKNYAKPNDKIFDSHVGSGSIRIACHDMGFDFEGCEIDKDYWEAQEKRYKTHVSQQDLFTPEVMQDTIYQKELL
jgi:site-specific DNA-methyltransferase (adenine-specific)